MGPLESKRIGKLSMAVGLDKAERSLGNFLNAKAQKTKYGGENKIHKIVCQF